MDPDRLTEDELAERSGTSRERIRQLADLGILQADDQGTFTRQDVMRARVVTDLHAMGIETEALATALASGHLLGISRVLAGGTLAQIARSPRWLKR
jgi:DNA-binding GntR family transcriptional regulator